MPKPSHGDVGRRLVEESWRATSPSGDPLVCHICEDPDGFHVCLLVGSTVVQVQRVEALDHGRLLGRVWRTALFAIR